MSAQDHAADLLDRRMQSIFQTDYWEYRDNAKGTVPRAYLNDAIRLVDNSGILEEFDDWDRQRRRSSAGRKAVVPLRAILIILFLHVRLGKGFNYWSMANTVDSAMTAEHLHLLGIHNVATDVHGWYNLLWRATTRMLSLVDPYPARRDRRMSGEEHAQLVAEGPDAIKAARVDWVANQIVKHSVRMLPKDIWDRYQGNTALDATKLAIPGIPNPTDTEADRRNCDPFSGRYRREGSHGGIGAKTDIAAYELETAVMAWNAPRQNTLFPSLITAVGFHAPGKTIGQGRRVAEHHKEFGFERFLLIADRAYNAAKVEDFQLPIRKLGIELVIDYPKNQLGNQGQYENLNLIDGNWYVNWMPAHLITGGNDLIALYEASDSAKGAIRDAASKGTKATLTEKRNAQQGSEFLASASKLEKTIQDRIDARTPYRMIPKGRPDSDGWQRFSYPDPVHMLHLPPTGATRGSISIPPMLNVKKDAVEPLKHVQKYQWRTQQWRDQYGMRSLVESSNNHLKDPDKEDLGNKHKRRGRGFAYHYLASAFMVASSNMRRILTFIEEEARQVAAAGGFKLRRRRRRKDPHGVPLSPPAASEEPQTPSPPGQ